MTTVYSVGHSNHPIETFCALLRDAHVRYLVDIRSVPHSKFYPQYNQTALMNAMEKNGVGYVFLGDELGGRIQDVTCYKNRVIPDSKTGYASCLDYDVIKTKEWFISGFSKLLAVTENGSCAILCSEENPETCHRELIVGRRLREEGYSLVHIRAEKKRPSQLSLFE